LSECGRILAEPCRGNVDERGIVLIYRRTTSTDGAVSASVSKKEVLRDMRIGEDDSF